MALDLDAVRQVAAAPAQHPEILGDGVVVSRAFLLQVAAELAQGRAAIAAQSNRRIRH